MIFTFSTWDDFCKTLANKKIHSITASDVLEKQYKEPYLVLKHDVETNVHHAYRMAEIEARYGHRGVYYVQAYLVKTPHNVVKLRQMQLMGHEISYHYDVMDSSNGKLDNAIIAYEENKRLFEDNGFIIRTVCQHGNPVVERTGYTSNRDFFRSGRVQRLYPETADIMVNFKNKSETEYLYFSDSGRMFNLIFDPINNDIIPSDDKNTPIDTLQDLSAYIMSKNCIISTHPHRWETSYIMYKAKQILFGVVKTVAKACVRIPILKRIMGRFYYLAKKI